MTHKAHDPLLEILEQLDQHSVTLDQLLANRDELTNDSFLEKLVQENKGLQAQATRFNDKLQLFIKLYL